MSAGERLSTALRRVRSPNACLPTFRRGKSSVGVIAFSVAQANAIADELDRLRVLHPELEEHFSGDRLEGVFVKHLESVQGDERDVIIFSVGYGRDRDGKFSMNFGPLNKEGGFRRLNVGDHTRPRARRGRQLRRARATSRSRSQRSRGARMLRDYIRYAEAGGNEHRRSRRRRPGLRLEPGGSRSRGGGRAWPRRRSRASGSAAFRIDIGIRDESQPEHFLLGIETDGESYRATPTARDRDRLREEVLTNLGWKVHRIWSLDWVRNRQGELERLEKALEAARAKQTVEAPPEPKDEPPPREREERIVEDVRDALEAGRLPWVVPYKRLDLPKQSGYYQFHESINRDKQRDLLIQLLKVEAPIHIDYAISRLAQAWGLQARRASSPARGAHGGQYGRTKRQGRAARRLPLAPRPGTGGRARARLGRRSHLQRHLLHPARGDRPRLRKADRGKRRRTWGPSDSRGGAHPRIRSRRPEHPLDPFASACFADVRRGERT